MPFSKIGSLSLVSYQAYDHNTIAIFVYKLIAY